MYQNQQALQKLTGKELEEYGYKVFKDIGLICFYNLGQTKLSNIAPEYLENEHLNLIILFPIIKFV